MCCQSLIMWPKVWDVIEPFKHRLNQDVDLPQVERAQLSRGVRQTQTADLQSGR